MNGSFTYLPIVYKVARICLGTWRAGYTSIELYILNRYPVFRVLPDRRL